MFPNTDDEAVHLVVDLDERRASGAAHRRGRMSGSAEAGFELGCGLGFVLLGERAQGSFEQSPDFVVISLCGKDLVTVQNPPGIGVNHEYRMIPGIEENRICGLRAYAMQIE